MACTPKPERRRMKREGTYEYHKALRRYAKLTARDTGLPFRLLLARSERYVTPWERRV